MAAVSGGDGLRSAEDLLFPELADMPPHTRARLQFSDEAAGQIERVAAELAALRAKAAAADRVWEVAERWIAATVEDPLGEPGILRAAGLDLRRRIDEAAPPC